jgi:hypothetical protein
MAPVRGWDRSVSFIPLLLIEPVFGARQIFWPVILVECSSPALALCFAVGLWRGPREISPGFPWPPVLFAHTSSLGLRLDVAPCGAISRIAVPGPTPWAQQR